MSGTSLDGVDIAFCTFTFMERKWIYSIDKAETIPYPLEWKSRLRDLENKNALEYAMTDSDYGHYLGMVTKKFLQDNQLIPDFIASHGHTIFHRPNAKFTSQIGKGSAIAATTGYPVVCDFRSTDVALGGQGAPLVPIGDRLLFEEYSYCLNLGGFGNISYEKSGDRIAFDVCPVNIVLNDLASFFQKEFDENGNLARSGKLHIPLLETLNELTFYRRLPPKSLGKEWVLEVINPVLNRFEIPEIDKLRTFVEHIADQVSGVMDLKGAATLLITGGGAFNTFLIEIITEKTGRHLILPDPLTINFKEALIFAFLGVLRWRNEINCLKSYTGSTHDSTGGAIYRVYPESQQNDL